MNFFSMTKKLQTNQSKLKMAALGAIGCIFFSANVSADFYISSFGTNQLMRFNEDTGQFLGVVADIQGPFASQIGFDGDLFVSSHLTGEVLRFDSITGVSKGVFIQAGEGGLTNPTAPNFGPDGLVYVGDLASNKVLRYNDRGEFIDVFADQATSGLNGPFMQTFDDSTMFIASGFTNSIKRYDLATKEYMGDFVAPGSGGLVVPVGLEFGPDGNLYTSSSSTNEVIQYDGRTGEFLRKFVPAGSGGMSSPRAIRFGGQNTDLYVISLNTNEVLQFDRSNGSFIRAVATSQDSGMSKSRGLTFTPRPEMVVYHQIYDQPQGPKKYVKVSVDHRIKDFVDCDPKVKLLSITYSDVNDTVVDRVKNAVYDKEDLHFKVSMLNQSGVDQYYEVLYKVINKDNMHAFATTRIMVPAN